MLANYDLSQGGASSASNKGGSEGRIQRVLRGAMALMGTPYRWGGTSPDTGFDCSGLVGYVFQHALGIELPRISHDMAVTTEGDIIKDRSQLTPGDLVFFGRSGRVNHVGIYVGEGRFLHAPSAGKDVRIDSMTSGYWGDRFLQARRLEI
jgi:cell wall-associated NlpC family hydrolase